MVISKIKTNLNNLTISNTMSTLNYRDPESDDLPIGCFLPWHDIERTLWFPKSNCGTKKKLATILKKDRKSILTESQ